MVQRYDIAGKYMVYPKDEGRIVLYEDYAELERKLRNFADQVLYAPCSKVTEEMAMEILGI
nr:MAG: hypothetical protein [Bacteriophage sp.]UVM95125.1 MAG: hypothetical protein [Bacteriophage sp.]UVX79918.1 MAG: hypothetical protein [Bacteriophage sp.]